MKKIISMLVIFILICPVCGAEELAPVMEYVHKTDFPTSDTMGEYGWRYQYNPGDTYADYTDLEFNPSGPSYVRRDGNGNVDNYVNRWTMHPGGPGPTSIVWVAPSAGTVRLTTVGGVCKSTNTASEVFAAIIHTDKNSANPEKLWYKVIDGTDNVGTDNVYNELVDVQIGDKIYFEIDCNTTAGAATVWNPSVVYTETMMYTSGGKELRSVEEIQSGAEVECVYSSAEYMTSPAVFYLTVYDDRGRLRAVKRAEYDDTAADERIQRARLVMPESGDGYAGWRIELQLITSDEGRSFPVFDTEKMSLR